MRQEQFDVILKSEQQTQRSQVWKPVALSWWLRDIHLESRSTCCSEWLDDWQKLQCRGWELSLTWCSPWTLWSASQDFPDQKLGFLAHSKRRDYTRNTKGPELSVQDRATSAENLCLKRCAQHLHGKSALLLWLLDVIDVSFQKQIGEFGSKLFGVDSRQYHSFHIISWRKMLS